MDTLGRGRDPVDKYTRRGRVHQGDEEEEGTYEASIPSSGMNDLNEILLVCYLGVRRQQGRDRARGINSMTTSRFYLVILFRDLFTCDKIIGTRLVDMSIWIHMVLDFMVVWSKRALISAFAS